MEKAKIKKLAFWPAFILLIGAIILNIVNEEAFTAVFNTLNNLFMTKLGWLAALAAIVCVVLCIAVMCSKFGKVKIGGRDAKPKMSNFSWFSLMLTSSLASGILVWGAAEPIYHIQDPASAITGIEPNSGEAAKSPWRPCICTGLSSRMLSWLPEPSCSPLYSIMPRRDTPYPAR